MEWVFVGIGVAVLLAVGWVLHRRFGQEPEQTHSNAKPVQPHDAKELVGSGLEGYGMSGN